MVTYGTTAIPSDQIEVISGGTVAISAAFENTMVVVGGMDTANGTATEGELVSVSSPSDAQQKFGEDSELHYQARLAFQNGVGELDMLPVEETSVTGEDPSAGTSGQLENAPIFDPNVQTEHEIVDQNGNDIFITYDIAEETVSGTEGYVDPVTGEFKGDGATSYALDYTYGDYSSAVLEIAADNSPRIVFVCTENESVVNAGATEVNDNATNFDFMHLIAGAKPKQSDVTATSYVDNYTDGVDERRVSLVFSPRGYVDDAETEEVRTAGAVGGYLASLALGLSSTNDSIGGLTGLRTDLTQIEAGTLIDSQVMPLIDYPPVTVAKDMTTSTTPKFERVYGMQVVDEATEISHQISREFVGRQNTEANRSLLDRSHRNAYIGMRDATPALLDDFTVDVEEDSSNPNQVNVEIGIDVVDIMDIIDVTISVGDIIRNEGVN